MIALMPLKSIYRILTIFQFYFISECEINRNPIKLLFVWNSWNKDPALP